MLRPLPDITRVESTRPIYARARVRRPIPPRGATLAVAPADVAQLVEHFTRKEYRVGSDEA
jgi:hypothetical protein